ncbi:MAG TPA: methyltransferase [Thermoanaerobaculia bacterium]|jgi:protein-S-isoprenylcysteine O-methyltransferase Ste14|nr:methyltransferase [Thermoanaerobaculia bacterium]
MLKMLSLLGVLAMIAALVGLYMIGSLISSQPLAIALQAGAILLMIYARVTFGRRSFHPVANPTTGGLVTSGPYHYIRHPIYAAACLFGWAGIAAHASVASVALGFVLLAGGLIRMFSEERLVAAMYPEYAEYAKRTKRMIPFVF